MHRKSASVDLINFEDPEYYDCLSRATREATWRPNNILNNFISVLRSLASLIFMAGLLLTFNWIFAVLLIVANIPGIWMRFHFAEILYEFRRQETPEERKSAYFNWLLTGERPSREIRLFGLAGYFMELFRQSFLKHKEQELTIIRKRTLVELGSDLFKAAAFLLIILAIADSTVKEKISLGQMAMYLVAFRQGMVYIREFLSSSASLYEDGLFISDTFDFLKLEENITAEKPVHEPLTLKQGISVENLSFRYPGNSSLAINNISLNIGKGEIVAIVGPNGAGKSTLVRLLCRLYDADSGIINYDGINIRHFDPVKYREHFSVVFQDFMLYNMSAGENIRMGNINSKDPERIRMFASETGIDTIIRNLPAGYDTPIGTLFKDSRELSWGEWQKLALARALYRDASVLVLDEPSSHLDADTEYEIFRNFRKLVTGRTSILISHRFTNVSLADRIIVLDKGIIVESGSHSELMRQKGVYYLMYMKQCSRFGNEN
jgi:ATP-binding cassette, subfamily B, bacterial